MRTWTFLKIMLLCAIAAIYINLDMYMTAIYPVIGNALAMAQMNNATTSSMWIQVYSKVSNYSMELWLILVLVLFHKEIIGLFRKTKEILNNEEDE